MDSFRGRTIDVQVLLLSVTVHLLSSASFGWRTNVAFCCGRQRGKWPASPATQQAGRQKQCRVVRLFLRGVCHFTSVGDS